MALILDGTNGLSDVDGTAGTPAIRGSDANTGIFFPAADTIAFAEGGVESMRLDPSGDFLLGTTTSSYAQTSRRVFEINGATDSLIAWKRNDGNRFYIHNNASTVDLWNTQNTPIVLATNNTERARIDSSGNLLVGTTSATGGRQMIAFDNAGQTGTRYIHSSTTYNGLAIQFLRANNSTSMGGIYCDGANTTYQTSSDYRLKENIQPMLNGLDKVMRLKPCTYKWKDMEKTGEGFIAHELKEVVPDCVYGEKDAVDAEGNPQYQGIDTSFLVATLTAAIQEQQAIIQSLTARIEALENQT